jgi:NAD(P)-dependent dehydrogenase (short-subunit alcohol dehydrogenase family)
MLEKKLKGCFIFTSSVSGYIPNPFAVMYGATKAFVTQFAASLAIEVRNSGIDVLAVHPSPVSSNFFDKAHKLESLEMAKQAAVSPDSVPGKMLTCVGRSHVGDLGSMAIGVRFVVACVPYDFLSGCFSFAAPWLPDYIKHNKNRGVTAK